jgi:hypothetical protein
VNPAKAKPATEVTQTVRIDADAARMAEFFIPVAIGSALKTCCQFDSVKPAPSGLRNDSPIMYAIGAMNASASATTRTPTTSRPVDMGRRRLAWLRPAS